MAISSFTQYLGILDSAIFSKNIAIHWVVHKIQKISNWLQTSAILRFLKVNTTTLVDLLFSELMSHLSPVMQMYSQSIQLTPDFDIVYNAIFCRNTETSVEYTIRG